MAVVIHVYQYAHIVILLEYYPSMTVSNYNYIYLHVYTCMYVHTEVGRYLIIYSVDRYMYYDPTIAQAMYIFTMV